MYKLLKSLNKYLLAAILLAVPPYPKFPFIQIPGTFVAIRLEDLLIAFSGIILILRVLPNIKGFFKDKLNLSVILFLLTGVISLTSAILITQTIQPHIGLLHFLRRVEYFIPLFLGFFVVKDDRKNLEFFFKIILVVVFLTFVYGFGQRQFGWPIVITQNEEYSKGVALRWIPGSHINSTFAGHYDLASFLVLTLPAIITSIFILKGKLSKLILITTSFAGLWLLVNSASRISLFSYLVSCTISLFLLRRYKALVIVFIVGLAFVGFNSNLLARYGRILEITKGKLFSDQQMISTVLAKIPDEEDIPIEKRRLTPTPTPIEVFEDRSTNIRLNVEWPRALRAFAKNPVLGTGFSSITLATDNDYLRLLGETGFLGFFAFFLIFAEIFIIILRAFPFHKNFSGIDLAFISGISSSYIGIFINAVFIDIFEASKFATIFWLLTGLLVGLAKNERQTNKIN